MATEKLVTPHSTWGGAYVCSDKCADIFCEDYYRDNPTSEVEFVFADDCREYIIPCCICGKVSEFEDGQP